jgi:hypothetical protein
MLAEIVCAVAVLMTLRHVLELLEQNAELAQQVLFLRFKVDQLRELSKKLMVSSDAWRMLGRRRPFANARETNRPKPATQGLEPWPGLMPTT